MSGGAPESVGTLDKVFEFEYESVPILLYRCRETGLRLAQCKVRSPTVHGYFAVQTEAFDDYGEPHTLEHLIFLGSERYPYKGVLDILANRCLAQGTNAWTDTDHTCYTVDTAGSEGFLNILPVYLDHVLFPTLKDSGFVTEVHHINGEGANAGVVYCEMQARENEAADMVDRAMKLAAYPGPCSYKSETGGRLKELRELTNEMVRKYHGKYYRPDNFCVIVSGQVDSSELCKAVETTVASIKASDKFSKLSSLERPFASPVPKPDAPSMSKMEFPAEDEKSGAICKFCWHGPLWDDVETQTGLSLLLAYLTEDAISPVQKAFVEEAPPLCSSVSKSILEQSQFLFYISLKSVDTEQLNKRDVNTEMTKILETAAQSDGSGIDLPRIRSIIGKKRRQHLSSLEGDPHELYSGEIIGNFLYAPDFAPGADPAMVQPGKALQVRLDKPAMYDALVTWPAERWAALCEKWMLGPTSTPRVTVFGFPSKACGERLQSDDAKRIEAQKQSIGEEGCKKLAEELEAAEEENDVDTPDEVAQSFKLPDVGKVSLIDISSVKANGSKSLVEPIHGKDANRLCEKFSSHIIGGGFTLHMQLDHTSGAQFATCELLLPTKNLTVRERELLPLWSDIAFELPLKDGGTGRPAMSYDSVVQALTDATVHYSLANSPSDRLKVKVKVEKERYSEGPLWITRLLTDVLFDPERLKVAAKRILNNVPNVKRNARALMRMGMQAFSFPDSIEEASTNVFRTECTLKAMVDEEDGAAKVAAELDKLRNKLLQDPFAIFVRIAGDLDSVAAGDPAAIIQPWQQPPFAAAGASPPSESSVWLPALPRERLADDAIRPPPQATMGALVYSSAEESNYWLVTCDSISDPRSPELAPLLVAIEYVTALEGPFWRKIRGKGLAYGYGINHYLGSGAIQFNLFKATDPLKAYSVAREIITGLCASKAEVAASDGAEGKTEGDEEEPDEELGLDPTALEAAQSGVLFGLFEPVDTIPGAMGEAFSNTLDRVPPDQLQWLLSEVQKVSADSVRDALKAHIMPMFDGTKGRRVSLVCPGQKKDQLLAGLKELSPPFPVAHFDVDEFVKTVSPSTGFSDFRSRVRAAAA